jgi:hypothetical protein
MEELTHLALANSDGINGKFFLINQSGLQVSK